MKVSLITACFNSAKTLRTAMDSVLEQRGVDVEYIIIDGGSSDGTVDIIKDFESKPTNSPTSISNGQANQTRGCTTPSTRGSRWRRAMS